MKRHRAYKDYLLENLMDPREAAAYLDAALDEGDLAVFMLALKDVVEALGGGVGAVARKSALNRESLYRMLSEKGNPRLSSLYAVMNSLGLQIHVTTSHSQVPGVRAKSLSH
jgi:probable addiction module antidote protein